MTEELVACVTSKKKDARSVSVNDGPRPGTTPNDIRIEQFELQEPPVH